MNSSTSHHSNFAGRTTPDGPFLSVIIATRNEVARLEATVRAMARHLETLSLSFEIIVSDDASTDDTVARCRALPFEQVRVLDNPLRKGPADAIKNGLLIAQGSVVLIAPPKLTAPVGDILPLIESLLDADIVLGAPSLSAPPGMPGSSTMTRSSFKVFRREATAVLFEVADFDDERLDSELLFLADRLGLRTVVRTAAPDTSDHFVLST